MDKQFYQIGGVKFQIILNSTKYKISDLFSEPQPYNLYINYYIEKIDESKVDETIIINDDVETFLEVKDNTFIINTDVSNLVNDNYNKQFSLFGNKGIIQKYILHILELKYGCLVFHGCAFTNDSGDVIIGLGGSGSGKSVLINVALQRGWKLICTEQVVFDKNMNIYKGNIFDNVSPLSEKLVREKLPKAIIMDDKRLVEPIGQKIFVDMESYAIDLEKISVDLEKLTIINVNFNGKNGEYIMDIEDKDYLLRLLQISASEKISFPGIIQNNLVDFPYIGDSKLRQDIIDTLIKSNSKKIILSNGFEGFNSYFE